MEFKLVTPPAVPGLPQRPSYLVCGGERGNIPNVRIAYVDGKFKISKCYGVMLDKQVETTDFQEALFHAHRMWNRP